MVLLGLGSNMGDRLAYLGAAAGKLGAVLGNMRFSRIFESAALLPPDASPEMDMPYLNVVIGGDTRLSPAALLAAIKAIEQELGRVQRCKWGPREIDIDILAMDGLLLQTPELTIPHKELLNRDFMMLPLADIAGEWEYPAEGPYRGKTINGIITLKGYGGSDKISDTGLKLHA